MPCCKHFYSCYKLRFLTHSSLFASSWLFIILKMPHVRYKLHFIVCFCVSRDYFWGIWFMCLHATFILFYPNASNLDWRVVLIWLLSDGIHHTMKTLITLDVTTWCSGWLMVQWWSQEAGWTYVTCILKHTVICYQYFFFVQNNINFAVLRLKDWIHSSESFRFSLKLCNDRNTHAWISLEEIGVFFICNICCC